MIKALWHTSKTSSIYLAIMTTVMFWLMAFIQGHCFKLSIKDVFHNHLKIMKNLQYILCRNGEKFVQLLLKVKCAAASVHFVQKPWKNMCSWYFIILKIVWVLLETFQYFLKNVRLLLKKILRKNDLFSNLLKERKCAAAYVHLRNYFEVKTD